MLTRGDLFPLKLSLVSNRRELPEKSHPMQMGHRPSNSQVGNIFDGRIFGLSAQNASLYTLV